VTDSVPGLVSAALQLGAGRVAGWSREEEELARAVPARPVNVSELVDLVRSGHDPLGDAFCTVRTPDARRPLGQTFTPARIVQSMVGWAAQTGTPARVVDPGTGYGRYLLAAGGQFPAARLVGVDVDPVATIIARGNLAAAGFARRANIFCRDYRSLELTRHRGKTLFIGNPPYVRHHQIQPVWKRWLLETASRRGLRASSLAGLHVHFFLATAVHGRDGDYGAFITSSEWLDVNYGSLVRDLLLDGLGGQQIHVLDEAAAPFADATVTGAITCFAVGGRRRSLSFRRVSRVSELGGLHGGRPVLREQLTGTSRWGLLTRPSRQLPAGQVELGELCRVHRGAVTGANRVWIVHGGQTGLPPSVLFPSVTKARELFTAGDELTDAAGLRMVADLPADLDVLDPSERRAVHRFLAAARKAGAADGYIARTRRPWWSVRLRPPAPLLASYMARRPPAFVRNLADARHINIAHGIYPREPLPEHALRRLAGHLRATATTGQGRTYAGGLTKFEPREMERLPVPAPGQLLAP
jgi:hypothetical protein